MAQALNDMHPSKSCPTAKAMGALIALAAGDALGWPQELRGKALGNSGQTRVSATFRPWVRRGGGRFYPHEEPIRAGDYSDDTQLALAVARSRLTGGKHWWSVFTRTELPLWLLYERGGGGATKRAADAWLKGSAPWRVRNVRSVATYYLAGGNGAAMRVLPHAIVYASSDDPVPLVHDVVLDGMATHGHPRALIGATIYATAAWWLLRANHTIQFGELVRVLRDMSEVWGGFPVDSRSIRGGWFESAERHTIGGYEHLWQKVAREMRQHLEVVGKGLDAGAIADDDEVMHELGCFGKQKGAGTVTAAAAVYLCSRYSSQPLQGVLRAAFAKGADTDTIAAMSGALLGCLAATDWQPAEWSEVQDYGYLRQIAIETAKVSPNHPGSSPDPIDRKAFERIRLELSRGRLEIDLYGAKRARVVARTQLRPLSQSTVAHAWKLLTSDGQTLVITKVGRRSSDADTQSAPVQQPLSGVSMPTRRSSESSVTSVVLQGRNVRSLVSFYERAFGLQAVEKIDGRIDVGLLSFASANIGGRPVKKAGVAARDHRYHILIEVKDVRATLDRVKVAGGTVVRFAEGASTRPTLFCTDPEGNLVEVTQK